jgi:hypothetical protein
MRSTALPARSVEGRDIYSRGQPYAEPASTACYRTGGQGFQEPGNSEEAGHEPACCSELSRHIYDKVGVSNRVELALWYVARVHEGKFRRKGT